MHGSALDDPIGEAGSVGMGVGVPGDGRALVNVPHNALSSPMFLSLSISTLLGFYFWFRW